MRPRPSLTAIASLFFVSASPALAAITYYSITFDSVGTAWTDAGDEYAYSIANSDSFAGPTAYSYSDYGQAPGYNSSATVGVEHASKLTSSSFHLYGKAYAYVSDDYGYAWCYATGEALTEMSFSLDTASRVTISGLLTLGGTGSATAYSNYFEIRDSAGQIVTSAANTQSIAFAGRLPAGTYSLYVSTSVFKEINFSGGDVYENAFTTYSVNLKAVPYRR